MLKKGDNAKIKFNTSSLKTEEITCRVKWIEKDRICLDFPENKRSVAYYLPEETELKIIIQSQSGVHVFDSIVINSPLEKEFVVEFYDDETNTLQRREFVRVEYKTDITLRKDGISLNSKTADISGGGIKFVSGDNITIGQDWNFSLYSPSLKNPIIGNGIIINKKLHQDTMYAIMQFTTINESERSKIMKLCFEQQAIMHRGH